MYARVNGLGRDYSLFKFDWLDYKMSSIINFAYQLFDTRFIKGVTKELLYDAGEKVR